MNYIHIKIGNRCFSINQAWIEILVYGTSYYVINLFLLKFLLNYSIDHDNNDQDNSTSKDSKRKNNNKNKIEIIRGGDDSITNEFLAAILKECFKKDVSYKITHPDLVEKIRSFLKATGAHGIKIVPLSIAVIAVIHQNRNFSITEIGGATLMVDNLPALKKVLFKSAVKGATVALVFGCGVVVLTTPTGKIGLSLIHIITRRTILKVLPALAKSPILQKEFLKLLIGSTFFLAPIHKEIGSAITSLPSIQKTLTRLVINCSDYVEALPADANKQNLKYVESYQKPDNRVIIKGSSDHIICIPERQTIRRTLTTIDTVGGKVIIGKTSRLNKKIRTLEFCEVDYKVPNDKIPELRDFNDVINVETLNKAQKMLSDADLLNEDDFNVLPKEPSIKIRNNYQDLDSTDER
jgi:hypothetical protein